MTCPKINNQATLDLTGHQPMFDSFFPYSQKTLGYEAHPAVNFISDKENAVNPLGKTGFYDPSSKEITIYTDGRHIKDVLRSIAHELVHHAQNERGEFDQELDTSPGYALEDGHLWNMEQEAYKDGNSCFRRWEDTYKQQLQESKKMKSNKIQEMVRKELKKILSEAPPRAGEEWSALKYTDKHGNKIPKPSSKYGVEQGQVGPPTPSGYDPKTAGKPKRRGNYNIRRLQRQLIRLNALDFEREPIVADGIAGWRTASALASVSPSFQCIGNNCKGSVNKLKNVARVATKVLAKKPPMSEDEARAATTAAAHLGVDQTKKHTKRAADTATAPIDKALAQFDAPPPNPMASTGGKTTAKPAADDDDKLVDDSLNTMRAAATGRRPKPTSIQEKRAIRVLSKLMEKIGNK